MGSRPCRNTFELRGTTECGRPWTTLILLRIRCSRSDTPRCQILPFPIKVAALRSPPTADGPQAGHAASTGRLGPCCACRQLDEHSIQLTAHPSSAKRTTKATSQDRLYLCL